MFPPSPLPPPSLFPLVSTSGPLRGPKLSTSSVKNFPNTKGLTVEVQTHGTHLYAAAALRHCCDSTQCGVPVHAVVDAAYVCTPQQSQLSC